MNTRSRIVLELNDKAYRDAFIRSQINVGIPFQARALRKSRKMSQAEVAEKAGMLQPRIAAIERPGGSSKLNLETLLRLASALDVGLTVRFASFSEVVNWAESFSPDSFDVPSFADDLGLSGRGEIVGQTVYLPATPTVSIIRSNALGAFSGTASDSFIRERITEAPVYSCGTVHAAWSDDGYQCIEDLGSWVHMPGVPVASDQHWN